MPTYAYRCSECDHEFDKYQSITEGVLRKCPNCGRLKLKRLIGVGSGILFRGTGWPGQDIARKITTVEGKTDGNQSSKSKSDERS